MRTALTIVIGATIALAGDESQGPPIRWVPPATFDREKPDLGLPRLEGVTHRVIYDPLPCKGNLDEGGDGTYESVRHGTYNHHQRMVLFGDKLIVYWTNHSCDENGPGQRLLAKVGTFNADRSDIDWGGDETLVELAGPPMPVRRRPNEHKPDVMDEGYASATLHLIDGRLYLRGTVKVCHGYTDDVMYHKRHSKPMPAEHYSDRHDRRGGFRWDMWWNLGFGFVQRWRAEGPTLVPDSPLYRMGKLNATVEVTPGRLKHVPPPIEPYASAPPFSDAPKQMQEDVVHGKRVLFHRHPKYAKGTMKLAADGKNGLAHYAEFRRPDGKWVVVRDNLINPYYYYAAVKDKRDDPYPPAIRTSLYGDAMPEAGELPDGSPWIICNSRRRLNMYITLSDDGITFDRTWLLLHAEAKRDGGKFKGGGPQYFRAVTVGPNIWVCYSIGKIQIGVARIPIRLLVK